MYIRTEDFTYEQCEVIGLTSLLYESDSDSGSKENIIVKLFSRLVEMFKKLYNWIKDKITKIYSKIKEFILRILGKKKNEIRSGKSGEDTTNKSETSSTGKGHIALLNAPKKSDNSTSMSTDISTDNTKTTDTKTKEKTNSGKIKPNPARIKSKPETQKSTTSEIKLTSAHNKRPDEIKVKNFKDWIGKYSGLESEFINIGTSLRDVLEEINGNFTYDEKKLKRINKQEEKIDAFIKEVKKDPKVIPSETVSIDWVFKIIKDTDKLEKYFSINVKSRLKEITKVHNTVTNARFGDPNKILKAISDSCRKYVSAHVEYSNRFDKWYTQLKKISLAIKNDQYEIDMA